MTILLSINKHWIVTMACDGELVISLIEKRPFIYRINCGRESAKK